MNKYKVDDKIGIPLAVYDNGTLTTAGFIESGKEIEAEGPVTYLGHAGTEVPVNWHYLLWIDDTGKKQKLKAIEFEEVNLCVEEHRAAREPVFVMEDGHKSWSVTEVEDD